MTWTEVPLSLSDSPGEERPHAVAPSAESARQWREVIDGQLVEWERNPDALADDGIEPPTGATIRLARQVARAARDAGTQPPTRVVVDGAGGIAFERLEGGEYETLLVRKDGSVEMLAFRGATLLAQRKLREPGERG